MTAPLLHSLPIQESLIGNSSHLRGEQVTVQRASCTHRYRLLAAAFFCALASAGVLAAQAPPQKATTPAPGITLRQTVRRVRVDVVVTDAQGQPVSGLRSSDFSVAEDRKPQTIRQFEWHSEDNPQPSLPKRPLLPAHTFMNLPTAPEHGPLMILLFDALNTPLDDQLNAREQMLEFLKKSSGRRIAIFYLGEKIRWNYVAAFVCILAAVGFAFLPQK